MNPWIGYGGKTAYLADVGAIRAPTYLNMFNFDTYTDTSAALGEIAKRYQNLASNSFNDAISGLKGLVADVNGSQNEYGVNVENLGSFNNYLDQLASSKNTLSDVQQNVAGIYSDANNKINSSTQTFDGVMDSLNGIYGDVGNLANDINALNGKTQPVYDNLNGIRDNLAGIADRIGNTIPQYANQLNDIGNSMYGTGGSLVDMGGLFNDQARNLMNMDSSGGGLIAEYIASLQSIDPNQYVSQAATDVQNAYQNAQAQQNRALGRSGVDAGSARSVALNQQYAQAMAAASAGAKFRARQAGNQERLSAMQGAINTAGNLAQTGASITSAGIQAQGQGAGVIGDAGQLELAGINAQLGVQNTQLGVQDAWLKAVASELNNKNSQLNAFNSQAALQTQIANAENAKNQNYLAAAKLGLEANNTIMNAEQTKLGGEQAAAKMEIDSKISTYGNTLNAKINAATALANAQIAQSKYYDEQATDWGKLAGSNGILHALFGSDAVIMLG